MPEGFSNPLAWLFGEGNSPTTGPLFAPEKSVARDLLLDINSHDLTLVGGDLVLVRDAASIRQEVDIRLNFLLGEWFLDTEAGVPYFQNILVKSPNLAAIRNIFNDEILSVAGIRSVVDLKLDFNRTTRKLLVTWHATTDLGALTAETRF